LWLITIIVENARQKRAGCTWMYPSCSPFFQTQKVHALLWVLFERRRRSPGSFYGTLYVAVWAITQQALEDGGWRMPRTRHAKWSRRCKAANMTRKGVEFYQQKFVVLFKTGIRRLLLTGFTHGPGKHIVIFNFIIYLQSTVLFTRRVQKMRAKPLTTPLLVVLSKTEKSHYCNIILL
jgi:hypothetical protein